MSQSKLKNNSITLAEFDQRFSDEEKQIIAQETKYLEVLMGLRKAREESGLTQEQLAEKSNIPRATITNIENGKRNATIKTLLSLGEAMGKSIRIQWV